MWPWPPLGTSETDTLFKMGFQTYIFCSKVPSKCRKCHFRDTHTGYIEVTLGLRWGYVGVTLGLHRVTWGLHRGYIGVTLGLHRGYIGVTLELHRGYIGVTLGLHRG